jgi:hypothetical protein
MPRDERKRQAKIARQAARRKERVRSMNVAGGQGGSSLAVTRAFLLAVDAPVHECLMPKELFEAGIGEVIFSRKMPEGRIAMAGFLLDVFCLGVKDALFKVLSEPEYRALLSRWSEHQRFRPIDPTCARKLVEEAEAYARDLGLSPHPDYHTARKIFGDVDPSACRMRFEFGKDGKPLYASGPYDSLEKSRRIIEILTERCGPDGFHYLVGSPEVAELDF